MTPPLKMNIISYSQNSPATAGINTNQCLWSSAESATALTRIQKGAKQIFSCFIYKPSPHQENLCLVNTSDDMKHILLFELN